MVERYFITGVQIGLLLAGRTEILKDIQDKQFIGNMQEPYDNYEIVIRKKKGKKRRSN